MRVHTLAAWICMLLAVQRVWNIRGPGKKVIAVGYPPGTYGKSSGSKSMSDSASGHGAKSHVVHVGSHLSQHSSHPLEATGKSEVIYSYFIAIYFLIFFICIIGIIFALIEHNDHDITLRWVYGLYGACIGVSALAIITATCTEHKRLYAHAIMLVLMIIVLLVTLLFDK